MSSITQEEMERVLAAWEADEWPIDTSWRNFAAAIRALIADVDIGKTFAGNAMAELAALRAQRDEAQARNAVVERITAEVVPDNERLLAQLAEARSEVERRTDFMERRGYRRCDIPACNCGSWHGGHADARLAELREEIGASGRTLLGSVQDLRAALAASEKAREAALIRGLRVGITRYAWWKDGAQYVGTCGTTLAKALEAKELNLFEWEKTP